MDSFLRAQTADRTPPNFTSLYGEITEIYSNYSTPWLLSESLLSTTYQPSYLRAYRNPKQTDNFLKLKMKVWRILIKLVVFLDSGKKGLYRLRFRTSENEDEVKLGDCYTSISCFSRKLATKWLRQWFFKCLPDQDEHHLGTCWKCKFLGPTQGLLNKKFCRWSPAPCVLIIPPGDSDTH